MNNSELYYEELTDLSVRIVLEIKNRTEPLDELSQAMTQLSQTNAIKGNAANAMKAYINEVHMTLIQTLELLLNNYEMALGKYVKGYLEVDSDESFKLIKEDFDAHENNLSSHQSDFTSIGSKLKAISDEAEDIISLRGAGSKRLFNVAKGMKDMEKTVSDLNDKWNKYEQADPGFNQVQDLIAQTTSLLKSTLSVPHGYSYSPGSFSKLISKDFVNAFKVNAKYVQDNQKDFKANWDRIGKNYKADQDRMEEAAKEKAKKGLIWDALEVCAGVVLVATGVGSEFGVMLIVGGVNGAINHASIATTGNSFNILGSLTNGAEQWYNKNIGEPLVKTGNPALQFAAGCGDAAIQFVGAKYQLDVYDIGDTVHTLWTNPEAQAQFKAGVGNYWNKFSSGNAYTIGQTTGTVLSFVVNPGDIGAAAGKASKAESLLGKVGTFSKSIAVSSVENAKNIAASPWRTVDNIGSKVADLRTVFSEGKGAIGDLTKSVVVSSAKNAKNIINLTGRTLDDVKKAAGFVNGKLLPASGEAVKSFGKVLKNTGKDLKGLTRQVEVEMPGVGRVSVGPNIEFSEVVKNFKNGVGDIKDNFVKAIKSGDKGAGDATTKVSTNYKKTFFDKHPDLKGKVVVHHSVEQQVLRKYPGLFTKEEIHAYKSLRGIPNDVNSEVHLSKIRMEWNKFYKDIAKGKIKATKENFLNKAKEIDEKFGDKFNPKMK